MDQKQISMIISAVISFLIALLTIFGYSITVIQPQMEAATRATMLAIGTACP